MPEVLIWGGKAHHCFSARPGTVQGVEEESCYQDCQEREVEYWAEQNVVSVHIPMEKMPNVPGVVR